MSVAEVVARLLSISHAWQTRRCIFLVTELPENRTRVIDSRVVRKIASELPVEGPDKEPVTADVNFGAVEGKTVEKCRTILDRACAAQANARKILKDNRQVSITQFCEVGSLERGCGGDDDGDDGIAKERRLKESTRAGDVTEPNVAGVTEPDVTDDVTESNVGVSPQLPMSRFFEPEPDDVPPKGDDLELIGKLCFQDSVQKWFDRPKELGDVKYPDYYAEYVFFTRESGVVPPSAFTDLRGRLLRKRQKRISVRWHPKLPQLDGETFWYQQLLLHHTARTEGELKGECRTFQERCIQLDLVRPVDTELDMLRNMIKLTKDPFVYKKLKTALETIEKGERLEHTKGPNRQEKAPYKPPDRVFVPCKVKFRELSEAQQRL